MGFYLRVSGGLEALTFSSYSSPRNTSGAIQYGEPTTAKGSFLTPSLQEGVRTLYSDVSPKQKGMGRAFSPPTENVTGSFTHVWGNPWEAWGMKGIHLTCTQESFQPVRNPPRQL